MTYYSFSDSLPVRVGSLSRIKMKNQSRYLFRGLTPQGEWVYGDLCQNPATYIWPSDSSPDKKVLPETVGQWTGLAEQFAGEAPNAIWEGDRLKVSGTSVLVGCPIPADFEGTVLMREGMWQVCNGSESWPLWSEAYGCEVVGNIHQPAP